MLDLASRSQRALVIWSLVGLAVGSTPIITSAALSATVQVPAPCRAAGLITPTFATDFRHGGSTFDKTSSYRPGFGWYRWNWFGVKPNAALVHLEGDGSLSARGGFEGHVTSAAKVSGRPGFVGTAFGGGACIEVLLRFDPVRVDGGGHQSFWAMAKEHLDGSEDDRLPGAPPGNTLFAEWDIFEYFKVPVPGFLSSWIDWYGRYIAKGEQRVNGVLCVRPYCKNAESFDNLPDAIPLGTDWKRWQRVTALWVPATTRTSGYVQTFFNGRPLAPPHRWRDAGSRGGAVGDFLDFSTIDRQHMVLIIGSGVKPIYVRSIRVFQVTARANLVN